MAGNILLVAVIIVACVVCNKVSNKIGMPMLLAFILLGMFFGTDGLVKIRFDNFAIAEQICSVALIFIMFYGGFGTKWSEARPIAVQAMLLSSAGTMLTAGLVGLFCYFGLQIDLLESLLIGSVISSTDAASVFSILRSKRLNLRYNTASLLEIESGSNDPFSYMLTVIVLALMNGDVSGGRFGYLLFAQVVYGVLFGIGIALVTRFFLRWFQISSAGFSAIFIVGVALTSYALPMLFEGNGYLSAYIAGIILGNCRLENKPELVHFFDGTTGLMQMLLFFLLGLLSFPSKLLAVAVTALSVALFLTFVARPLVVFLILTPFRSKLNQQLLVAWSGMRGAASIVFAIMATINSAATNNDIFHIVFFIVLFSILLQGTLIPLLSKWLGMTDDDSDVLKTFNDYMDEDPVQFIRFTLPEEHAWVGKRIEELLLPPDLLFVMLTRGKQKLVPNGATDLQAGDTLILGGISIDHGDAIELFEKRLHSGNEWLGKAISELRLQQDLIILIKRGQGVVIPKGDTVLQQDDTLVITNKRHLA